MWSFFRDLFRRWLGRVPFSTAGWLAGELGDAGERLAEDYLRGQGIRTLVRRHRTPLGEIDLICREGQTIVFVEVKTRRGNRAGEPAEAVDHGNRRQLTRLALGFLKQHGLLEHPARFDVVSVIWPADGRDPQITHIRNAFEAHGRGQLYS